MSKIVIGCDPDSKASGIAVYKNGFLEKLECMPLIEIMELFQNLSSQTDDVTLHIENVAGKKAVWHGRKESKAAFGMACQRVGMCKQSQIEVERIAEHYGIEVIHHPVSKAWKSQAGKEQFKRVTHWAGRTNEDTRSAAYFGWLGTRV